MRKWHFPENGTSFCSERRNGKRPVQPASTLISRPGVASGWCPVVGCSLNCQNCSFKRTPGRTLLHGLIRLSAGVEMPRTGVIRHFDCHFTVCYTQVIVRTSTDAFPVVGGTCAGREHRCKARQGRRGKRTLTFELNPTLVRFLNGVDRRRRILW